ncbi:universal stress protein [Pseudoclavibacter sp. 13-3]|uniref:universal stress protein n=1 Tax=Pseudoclavibacter sp. 13-3 TaxID=2901228 RepID=UPI001E476CBE|nr:universal stress protein [Pseudoclavibacter sp. 13-3]MCD7101339.1 universal stress protein [Pseudoclavibacter sp. 13-3]
MRNPLSIVVAYRNTSAGRDALRLGSRIAATGGGAMHIVAVTPEEAQRGTLAPRSAAYDRYLFDQTQEWLEAARELVPKDVEAHTHIEVNDSEAQGLLDATHRLGAKLIVIGTATGGLLGRFTLGSVSNVLLHSSDVAVALAPDNTREVSADEPISRISVAIGDLGGNRRMFATAAYLATERDVPVRLLTLAAVDRRRGREEEERVRTSSISVLDTAALQQLPQGIDVTTHVEVAARIDQAVEQVEWDPNEIVLIGSSRIAQAPTTFLGSTAAKLVRSLTVPMIVVPRDEQHRTDSAPRAGV